MAKRIKGLRQKLSNAAFGSITPIGADAVYVDLQNGKNVEEVIGDYDDVASIAERLVTMRGASGSIAGIGGLVPIPAAGDEHKVLQGDGTWGDNNKNYVGTMTSWEALPIEQKLLYDTADIQRGYFIQYFANGGSGIMASDEAIQGTSYYIKENTFDSPIATTDTEYTIDPLNPGHQYRKIYSHPFDDWNTQSDGSGVNYQEDEDIIIEQALNLYAQWDNEDTGEFTDEQYYLTVNPDEHVVTCTPSYWYDEGSTVNVTAITQSGYVITSGTGNVIMDSAKTVDIKTELALKFSSDESFTLSVATPGWLAVSNPGYIQYSVDNGTSWSTWDGSELSGTASQPIYLRGKNNTVITGNSDTYKWTFTGKYITGNIETLLNYETVSSGGHPIMGKNCYNYMFHGCASLITPPELPATTLAEYCYNRMFWNCTSLTIAPELPATKLETCCYQGMFLDCKSLTTPPQLPAITLAWYCYELMFHGCTSLINAPELPATILTMNCYSGMFGGCTSLITAPSLSATTLAESCYDGMFTMCTSLTTIPKLSVTQLVRTCYSHMFDGCTSLKISTVQDSTTYKYAYRIPTSNTGTTATDALTDMFSNTVGAFTGTPIINTTYYTDHQPV